MLEPAIEALVRIILQLRKHVTCVCAIFTLIAIRFSSSTYYLLGMSTQVCISLMMR